MERWNKNFTFDVRLNVLGVTGSPSPRSQVNEIVVISGYVGILRTRARDSEGMNVKQNPYRIFERSFNERVTLALGNARREIDEKLLHVSGGAYDFLVRHSSRCRQWIPCPFLGKQGVFIETHNRYTWSIDDRSRSNVYRFLSDRNPGPADVFVFRSER